MNEHCVRCGNLLSDTSDLCAFCRRDNSTATEAERSAAAERAGVARMRWQRNVGTLLMGAAGLCGALLVLAAWVWTHGGRVGVAESITAEVALTVGFSTAFVALCSYGAWQLRH
jgi:hypothetical protein